MGEIDPRKLREVGALAIILGLLALLLYAIWPFISAFFGALILFVLFRPMYKYLVRKKRFRKDVSAGLVIFVSIIIILIPLLVVLSLVAAQFIDAYQGIGGVFQGAVNFVDGFVPGYDLSSYVQSEIPHIGKFFAGLFFDFLKGSGFFLINLLMMYFILYYLLIGEDKLVEKTRWAIPFNKKNTDRFIEKFKDITSSTIIVSGIVSLLQGALVTVTFLIFGVGGAFLWGFVAAVLAFLPIVGTPIVWVPASIVEFARKDIVGGVGILVFGIFLSNIDNFIRPYLQHKVGRIHPLVTLVGIFIGLPLFGLIGIFAGPLLIAYTLLAAEMFRDEYLS